METTRKPQSELRREAESYYRLCREAEALGIVTSLDDPSTPPTVAALQDAVATKRAEQAS